MKFALPPKRPPAPAASNTPGLPAIATLKPEPAAMPKDSFYRSADEAARRKQAILAQLEQRRMQARAELRAGRLARQSSHL